MKKISIYPNVGDIINHNGRKFKVVLDKHCKKCYWWNGRFCSNDCDFNYMCRDEKGRFISYELMKKPKYPILRFIIKCLIIIIQLLCTTKSFLSYGSTTKTKWGQKM